MFSFAILIGLYGYTILSLGLLSLLFINQVLIVSILYICLGVLWYKKNIQEAYSLYLKRPQRIFNTGTKFSRLTWLFIFILLVQILINLVGVFGPELAFDALWYHLTLPKLYAIHHAIFYIPGGLLYYSTMPKLTEMFYTAALLITHTETATKLIHFVFGILSAMSLYFLSRRYFSSRIGLLAVVVFYANLVVAWEGIVSYIDLARTFFEVLALWGFLMWTEKRERKWLIESAVMLGLAISTKILSFGSIVIFIVLIILEHAKKKQITNSLIVNIGMYVFFSVLIPLPWFTFSFVNTGNLIYPFFSSIYKVPFDTSLLNPARFIADVWQLFTRADDPISPLYIIVVPLIILEWKEINMVIKTILYYSAISILVWYFTPRTGGGRFILPYLPAYSIIAAFTILKLTNRQVKKYFIFIVVLISCISIGYRGFANAKYIKVLAGKESKAQFLASRLNFLYGDFYDTDRYFLHTIKKDDTVLTVGFHNLYYVDFPFIDSSWIKKGDRFNYIAVQDTKIPKRFSYWKLIYTNDITHVQLYSLRGQSWVY